MDKTEQKIVQYLSEAHATEQALVTALQSQIAMTPGGSYRGRITTLRDDEPWPGYDELSVDEVRAVLDEGDEDRIKRVHAYERSHKNRAGVIDASERELARA